MNKEKLKLNILKLIKKQDEKKLAQLQKWELSSNQQKLPIVLELKEAGLIDMPPPHANGQGRKDTGLLGGSVA